jgi:hypothetical protein
VTDATEEIFRIDLSSERGSRRNSLTQARVKLIVDVTFVETSVSMSEVGISESMPSLAIAALLTRAFTRPK